MGTNVVPIHFYDMWHKYINATTIDDALKALSEQFPGHNFQGPFPAVVFGHRNDRWALSVDALLEQAEVVVKPSPEEVGDVPHVAGATILGDGRVSMILDLSAIVTNLTRGDLKHAS